MTLTLKVIDGPHKGKVFQFEHHDTFMVGRASDATFRLSQDDAYFSRNHFLIEFNPPSCRLLDLNSRNGTFVNGQQVTSIDLREGDLIRGGQTTIRVGFGSEANSSARPSLLGAAKTILPQLFSSSVRNQPTIPPTTSRNSQASPAGQASVPTTRPSRDSSKTSQTTELPLFTGYRTIREIGRGAMGVVYEAETLDRSKRVAIKAIIPNAAGTAEDISRFLREASILRDLVHPHIVGFREFIESNTDLCIVMDYIEGTNAASVVKKTTQGLSVDKSVRFTIQLLDALHFAHQQGFVHRDVKPANLLVTNQNNHEKVYLADFGLARMYQSSKLSGLTMTGQIGGTTAFMPPEQITHYRKINPAADQYSAAASLYYMLTRQYVYELPRDVANQLLMILQQDPIPIEQRRTDLPPKLIAALRRALARDPAQRFPNAAAFRMALQQAIQ